jgi:hypothetical protein
LKVPRTHPEAQKYRQFIADAKTAMEAKQRGQTVPLRPDWESIKTQLMEDVLLMKFEASSKLCKRLLATGTEELVEGNNWGDTYWGKVDGKGKNELGKALMRARERLRTSSD